ncbi:MAG TPA: hypothetical protein VM095_01810 [Pyrinomonadaceae bacterium]|nr:hypothetical protein [Pyrinomonadaceae bacterium]
MQTGRRSPLFLALFIIAALFLSSCVKEKPKLEVDRKQAGTYSANTGVVADVAEGRMAQP